MFLKEIPSAIRALSQFYILQLTDVLTAFVKGTYVYSQRPGIAVGKEISLSKIRQHQEKEKFSLSLLVRA